MFEGASAVPEVGLVFYLPFNGNAEPVEGEVTSMTGELTYGEANGIGYAVFDGSGQIVKFQFTEAVTNENGCTFAAVHRGDCADFNNEGGKWNVIFDTSPDNSSSDTRVFNWETTSDNRGRYRVKGGSDITTVPDKQFYSIITTISGSEQKSYLNGELLHTRTHSSNLNLQNGVTGQDPAYFGNPFIGYVCDIAVWNRVLTEEEIAQVAARAASMN